MNHVTNELTADDIINELTLADIVLRWRAISGGHSADWFWRQVNNDILISSYTRYLPTISWINYPLSELYRISFYPGFKNPFQQVVGRDAEVLLDYVIGNGFLSEEKMERFLPLAVENRRLALEDGPHSPLEPFSLLLIKLVKLFFSFTDSSVFMLLTSILVRLLMLFLTNKINKCLWNEKKLAKNALSHYLRFLGLFVAFTSNQKQPPAFGAAPAFFCILSPFLGLLFCHIPNNLSNYNVLTANSPFFYQISGTWSNHEGSILLWCWISSLYGFLLCFRGQPPPPRA